MKKAIISFLGCILVICIIAGCNEGGNNGDPTDTPYPDGSYGVNTDDIIENIILQEADGGTVALSDSYNNYQSSGFPKAILVDFSSMSSPDSQSAASNMNTIYNDFSSSGDDIEIITILFAGTYTQAQQWKSNFGLISKVASDTNGDLVGHYNITTYPTFYIIAPSTMKIIQRIEGWVDITTLENAITPVVSSN